MTIQADTGIWTIGNNWPWPRVYFTNYYVLAFAQKADGKLALYELTNKNDIWYAEEKTTLGNVSDIINVSVADFYTYYFISVNREVNNTPDKVIYQKNVSDKSVELIPGSESPYAGTCCNFLGQLILGDIQSSASPWNNLDACIVAWSDIGSTKMNPTENVVAGFAKMPWDENGNGKIWRVMTLKNHVRCYGDLGCCNLIPYSMERHTGFGIGELERPGLLGPNAVAGDDFVHGFVDSNYDWTLITDKQTEKLGYRKLMKQLDKDSLVVSYDPYNKRFYISDGSLCFVYVKNGMYSTHQCVSSIGYYKGILCGFVKENSDTKIRLTTKSNDFGFQDEQTIESVETGLRYTTSDDKVFQGAIATAYGYNEDFIQLGWQQLNERGIFTQKCTGREFKISLQADYDALGSFSLSNLKAKIKFPDKRNTRGRLNVN